MVNSAFSEEDERRTAWIDYYVTNGQLDEARALGWVGDDAAELPQWKQYEIQQQQEKDAAIPKMFDLDDILWLLSFLPASLFCHTVIKG